MTAYNPAEVERLIAEAREDDARMTRAPWVSRHDDVKAAPPGYRLGSAQIRCDDSADQVPGGCLVPFFVLHHTTADAIARTRNNLRAMAEQLESARAEVDHLTAALPNWSHAEALQQRDALIAAGVAAQAEIRRLRSERVPLSDLQREATEVNDLNGVVAFCAGVFARIARCNSLDEAKTCAEMGAQSLEERRAGLWKPGPHDDPADWKPR